VIVAVRQGVCGQGNVVVLVDEVCCEWRGALVRLRLHAIVGLDHTEELLCVSLIGLCLCGAPAIA